MSQDEVNETFRSMVFANAVDETERIIREVVGYEMKARHAISCDEDPQAAQDFANTAHTVLAGVPYGMLPSVVMGIADLFNREHEGYTLALDHLADIAEHLRQFKVFWERGDTTMALASLGAVDEIVVQALEGALYEKDESS